MNRRFRQIFIRTYESVKIGAFMGPFFLKKKYHELKIYIGVMCNDTEELWKIWRAINFSFPNWHKQFDKFWLEHRKVSKIYTLTGCFSLKYFMFELKKCRGIMFHNARNWCKIWRKSELWFEKWHKGFDKFWLEHTKVSKLGHFWGLFIQSRKCMSFKFTKVLCVMKNDTKF